MSELEIALFNSKKWMLQVSHHLGNYDLPAAIRAFYFLSVCSWKLLTIINRWSAGWPT
jgi:hypothetical protein